MADLDLDVGFVRTGIGPLGPRESAEAKALGCVVLRYGHGAECANIYELNERIHALLSGTISARYPRRCRVLAIRHFPNIKVGNRIQNILGVRILEGSLRVGEHLHWPQGRARVLSLTRKGQPLEEARPPMEVGLLLEGGSLVPLGEEAFALEASDSEAMAARLAILKAWSS